MELDSTLNTVWVCHFVVDGSGSGIRGSPVRRPLLTTSPSSSSSTLLGCSATRRWCSNRQRDSESNGEGGGSGASLEGLKGLSWQ